MRVSVCIALVYLATGLRRKSHRAQKADTVLPHNACPVMGALVNRGLITLDSTGRATQNQTLIGLMATGNSYPMAAFQALGIAAFVEDDPHQEKRSRDGSVDMDNLYLNYNLWNPETECTGNNEYLADGSGRPCNANIGFQQHGYSTTLRDPTNGQSADARWTEWMERSGVLVYDPTLRPFDRVMKIGEFALNADNSFSGSPLSFYHPSVAGSENEYLACSQWQAVGAWAAFWAAFARSGAVTGRTFMPEEDLRRFFFDADFPADWSAKAWGFKESFMVVRDMQGMGAGEEWTEQIVGILDSLGDEASEEEYYAGMLGALTAVGSRRDDVNKPYPR